MYYDLSREKELKKKPFSGWYFLFEYSLFSALGQIIAFIIGVLFYRKYWAEYFPFIALFFAGVTFLEMTWWLRSGGIVKIFPIREFKPFFREIMGKDPYPDPEGFTTTNAKPTRLFLGCSLSLIPLVIALITLVVAWYRHV